MKTGVKVYEIMTAKPITVGRSMSIKDCARAMLKADVGSVIVKEKDRAIGVITEKDIVERIVARGINPNKVKVENVMTRKLKSIEPTADVYEAIKRMSKKKVRRLPVVHNGKLVGLLTEKDVLKIQPELFDIISEKYRIKEYKEKKSPKRYVEGWCEECNNYAQLYETATGELLCEECKDEIR